MEKEAEEPPPLILGKPKSSLKPFGYKLSLGGVSSQTREPKTSKPDTKFKAIIENLTKENIKL